MSGGSDFRYNIDGLAMELDVEMGDVATLFLNYFFEMKSEKTDMIAYLEKGDWDMLQRTVHNIKGVSANLGISDVVETADTLNRQLKQGKTDNAALLAESLSKLLDNAETDIKSYFMDKGLTI